MKKDKNFFVKQFKKILYEQGLTQQEFAEKLGVDQVMISQWMNAARNPSVKSIRKISKVLNVPFDYFIEKEEDNKDEVKFIKKQIVLILEKINNLESDINFLKRKIK